MTDRREAFTKLLDAYGIDPDGNDYSGEEDARLTLDGDPDYPLDRFAAVTHSGEFTYIRCFATLDGATRHEVANVNDSLYAEAPGEIVDLDSGEKFAPDWSTLRWKAV